MPKSKQNRAKKKERKKRRLAAEAAQKEWGKRNANRPSQKTIRSSLKNIKRLQLKDLVS